MATADPVAQVLADSLEKAQAELSFAEIGLVEATARAATAREAAERLVSAVAALSGERPPAVVEIAQIGNEIADSMAAQASRGVGRAETPIQDMTPEEFDAQRQRRQREREKEAIASNPLAHLRCSGCGGMGTLQDSMITAPSGAIVRMMVCTGCGNQVMS